MPVIKSAIKKLRKDRKREKENNKFEKFLKDAIKNTKKTLTDKNISNLFSLADKAAKKHIIHKNKAARIKSRITKLAGSKTKKSTTDTKTKAKVNKTKKSPKK